MKAKARIAALFNRPGAARSQSSAASAPRAASPGADGSGAPAVGRARLALAFTTLASLIVMIVLLLTPVAPAAASEGCPNEARREEQGAAGRALPDCRAYELVSPSYTPSPEYPHYFEGVAPLGNTGFFPPEVPFEVPTVESSVSIADNGNAALFGSREPNSEQDGESNNLSRRGSDGWVGENIEPPQSHQGFLCLVAGYTGFSPNLEQIVIRDGFSESEGGEESWVENCGHDEPRLVPGESEESGNMFLRDTATGAFQLINLTPPGVKSYEPWFDYISADGSHVVFQSRALLTPDAPAIKTENHNSEYCEQEFGDVYVWSGGTVHLLTILPDGSAVRGTLAGAHVFSCSNLTAQSARFTHSVSPDGERMLFYSGGGFEYGRTPYSRPEPNAPSYIHGALYLREHPGTEQSALNGAEECTEPAKACTIQVDVPESGASGSSGGGQFQWANAETTKIFFTDEEKLTSDSTAEAGKPDLYEYDLEKPAGRRLTDLTVNAPEAADVLGVSGASEDGSYVYFVAKGVLSASQENSHGAKAVAGEANLYLRHAGATTFIATLNATQGDQCDWSALCLTSRVSANGAFIAFDSIDSLTGYDNNPVHPEACEPLTLDAGQPCMETFRYAAGAGAHGELTCASCNPTGAPPASEFAWSAIERVGYEAGIGNFSMQLSHNVTDSGEVFFNTMEKLVPTDENGTWDVYEYDGGEGQSAQLYLISSGKSEQPSYFADATANGSDVFILTDQPLVRSDLRADYDLYDARVGGGFAEPLIPQCETEGCRPSYAGVPGSSSPGSASLEGAGNVHPAGKTNPPPAKCKKGLLRSHGKCVKQHKKHKKQNRRAVRHNRRAAK